MSSSGGWGEDMTTTYDFGRGPVPAHRHTNPDGSVGGWVADSAEVHQTAWIHETATVAEWCSLGAGCSLGAWCRIGAGCILGSAEFLRTPPQTIIKQWVCSLYSPTQVAIGCHFHTFDDWERPRFLERLAKRHGADATDINQARAFIALCRRMALMVVREVQS